MLGVVRRRPEDDRVTVVEEHDGAAEDAPVQVRDADLLLAEVVLPRDGAQRARRVDIVALVGASGSGKSTLLKTVNRLVEPTSGTVRFDGEPIANLPLAALRHRIGYVFQSIGLFPHMTVSENIAIGPRLVGGKLAARR